MHGPNGRDQIVAMQKEQQEVAEKHSKELEDAKRLGAEEEQQKFANMSWLERIQKKSQAGIIHTTQA